MAYAEGASPVIAELERAIHARWAVGDLRGAATAALHLYGPEVLGYLRAVHRDTGAAEEVFAIVGERLWSSLARFRWTASLRTYLYTLARHQSARLLRDEGRRRARLVPLAECEAAWTVAAPTREPTLSCLTSDGPRSLTHLRGLLSPEDRELLVLRVDRELPWATVARIFLGEGATSEAEGRESARLRRRFQLIRGRLLAEGRARGLFGRAPEEGP